MLYGYVWAVKEELNIANCFLLQFQSGVCNYSILIQSHFSHSHWEERNLVSDRIIQPHILTLSLNLNHYFNLTIIAYNSYGMSVSAALQLVSVCSILVGRLFGFKSAFFLGTHSVIAINPSNDSVAHINCFFNEGSLAIGCLIFLTSMVKEITYCIVQQRNSNVSSVVPIFQTCKAKFAAGRYWLQVYDIETDGRISTLPAVEAEIQLGPSTPTITVSRMPNFRAFALSSMYSFYFYLYSIDALSCSDMYRWR